MAAELSTDDADPETRLLSSMRGGDEHTFELLVGRHAPGMLRVARTYVGSDVAAEDVVQDTWLAVMRGLERFEGRCSMQTWLYRILINRAKSSGVREKRTVPVSPLPEADRTVDPQRFLADGDPDRLGHWADPPRAWQCDPELQVIATETRNRLRAAIDTLPDAQRQVLVLRDVEGLSGEDTAQLLRLSAGNQRMLLHRARASLRQALEDYLGREVRA